MRSISRVLFLIPLFGLLLTAPAEETSRIWKSKAGTEIEAVLVEKTSDGAVLKKADGSRISVKLVQLSEADRAYIADAILDSPETADADSSGPTHIEGLEATPGVTYGPITCLDGSGWTYHLYLPKAFRSDIKWPILYVMNPGGGDQGTLDRYKAAADQFGIILACSVESKNHFSDSGNAAIGMYKDTNARLPLLEKFQFSSGMSGGARIAFVLAEYGSSNIMGVLGCAAGSNIGAGHRAKLNRRAVVCSLVGSNDFNRAEIARDHTLHSRDARAIWFAGNHDWADSDLIIEGFAHIYGKILAAGSLPDIDARRAAYAESMLAWCGDQENAAPWRASLWYDFLARFPGPADNRTQASQKAAELAKNPLVVKAKAADDEIDRFVKKYFSGGDTRADQTPDSSRQADAEKRAAAFDDLPHGEILRRLGGSPVPM